jgi:hypothetical protein
MRYISRMRSSNLGSLYCDGFQVWPVRKFFRRLVVGLVCPLSIM